MTDVTVRPGWAVVPRKDAYTMNNEQRTMNNEISELAAAEYYRQPEKAPKKPSNQVSG